MFYVHYYVAIYMFFILLMNALRENAFDSRTATSLAPYLSLGGFPFFLLGVVASLDAIYGENEDEERDDIFWVCET